MSRCVITAATAADVEHVAANLRPEHVREIRGLVMLDPGAAILLSFETSLRAFALRADDRSVAVAGVSRKALLSDTGSVWMLATPELDRHAVEAAARLRELFSRAHAIAEAPVLEQWIPAWYAKARKWLLWLGWRPEGVRDIRGQLHIRMMHKEGVA